MNKYFMLDTGIIYGLRLTNAVMETEMLKKDEQNNPLFGEEYFAADPKLWEVRFDNGYPNVIYDEEFQVYRCYYTLFTYDESSAQTPLADRPENVYRPKSNRITSLCYAESKDGIHFVKPDLGLVKFNGDKHNNILMLHAHGSGVLYDRQEPDSKKRYKLVTKIEYSEQRNFMAVAFSSDGIHFGKPLEWAEHNPAADSHNFPFRDERTGRFILLTRTWQNGLRICARSESQDFLNWTEPVEIMRGDGFDNELYSMVTFPYGGIYLGMASIYHNGDTMDACYDTVDVELKFSTDTRRWDSVAKGQTVIPRGEGKYPTGAFDCGCIYASRPIFREGKIWVYYMGGNGKHTGFRETSLARGYFEPDKFAGYVQKRKNAEAVIVTNHFNVFGNRIEILADIEEGGKVSIALGTKGGMIYRGFEAENGRLEKSDDGYYRLFYEGRSIMELHAKPVSLIITFHAAKLYALRGTIERFALKY